MLRSGTFPKVTLDAYLETIRISKVGRLLNERLTGAQLNALGPAMNLDGGIFALKFGSNKYVLSYNSMAIL